MKKWRISGLLFLLVQCVVVNAQEVVTAQQNENQIFLKFNEKSPFVFMGKIDVNKAGANGAAILYPGDNALVFFTAILTHAAISGGVDHSRMSKEQLEANKVFDDYQPYIQQFNIAENVAIPQLDINVVNDSKKIFFLTDVSLKDSAKWKMDVAPIFFMTQNYGSLILYNKVVLQENSPQNPKVKKSKSVSSKKNVASKDERIVVVISDPIIEPDFKHYWSSNEGVHFMSTLKNMYKESLSLVIANKLINQKSENSEQVTVKYIEDGVKKIERGYVITSSCRRTLFTSLSGEIKSVPNLDFLNCNPST